MFYCGNRGPLATVVIDVHEAVHKEPGSTTVTLIPVSLSSLLHRLGEALDSELLRCVPPGASKGGHTAQWIRC